MLHDCQNMKVLMSFCEVQQWLRFEGACDVLWTSMMAKKKGAYDFCELQWWPNSKGACVFVWTLWWWTCNMHKKSSDCNLCGCNACCIIIGEGFA